MWRDALLVAGKDLRIEARSRVASGKWSPSRSSPSCCSPSPRPGRWRFGPRRRASSGRRALLHRARHPAELRHRGRRGDRDGLRLSGLDPAGIFLGKAAAVALQLLVLQLVLFAASFSSSVPACTRRGWRSPHRCWPPSGSRGGCRVRRPLGRAAGARDAPAPVVLPVLAPVLLAGSRAWAAALATSPRGGQWLKILGAFAAVYVVVGVVLYGPLRRPHEASRAPQHRRGGHRHDGCHHLAGPVGHAADKVKATWFASSTSTRPSRGVPLLAFGWRRSRASLLWRRTRSMFWTAWPPRR